LPRLVSTLLVIGLLGGTAAAFAVTERLKLVPSPLGTPRVTEAFSPVCACETDRAVIEFPLREPDRLTVSIVDEGRDVVATIAEDDPVEGVASYAWDGRGAREGVYRVQVHLEEARRTIVIPNQIRLDTTPPVLTVESVRPTSFSPDGDGNADRLSAVFSVDEPSRVSLLVDGERAVETPPRSTGKLDWYARDRRAGTYVVELVARDLAGNPSERSPEVSVRLRFIELAPRRMVVPAGFRFGVRVDTDAERYAWRLGSRRGTSRAATLVLRAPTQPGRYTLRVSYGSHRDAIPVFVRAQP
jgi:hypothetical protein